MTNAEVATAAESTAPGEAEMHVGTGDMCRLTVVGPTGSATLAIPSGVPVAELLPVIVGHLDPELPVRGLSHDGWVLQRLGEEPLSEDRGVAAGGIFDGDVLYLRPRSDPMSLAVYDDLVDGVQSSLTARGDLWSTAMTRLSSVVLAGVSCYVAVFVAVGIGSFFAVTLLALLGVLVCAGAVIARRIDAAIGSVVLGAGVLAGGLAGAAAPSFVAALVAGNPPPATIPTDAQALITTALTAVIGASLVALVSIYAAGGFHPVLTAVCFGGFLVAVGLVVPIVLTLPVSAAASVVLVVALASARGMAQFAAWVGGVSVEPVPTERGRFGEDLDAASAAEIEAKAHRAARLMTSMWWVWSVVVTCSMVVLSVQPTWSAIALLCAAAVAILMQSRETRATWHRVACMTAVCIGLLALAASLIANASPIGHVAAIVVFLAIAANAVALAVVLPGRRLVPTVGRWGDIVNWLCALAVPVMMLAECGLFHWLADTI